MSATEQHERRPPDEDTSNGRLTPISATMHDVHRWLQRSLEQQARNEALLHITRLQSHARQIELEMELARVEAKRWGRYSKEAHALVQDSELAHEARALTKSIYKSGKLCRCSRKSVTLSIAKGLYASERDASLRSA